MENRTFIKVELPCNKCIKSDVCSLKINSNQKLSDLEIPIQNLAEFGVILSATCTKFYEKPTKIL